MAKSQVFEQDRERWVGFGDMYDASTVEDNSPLITRVSVSRGIAEALTAFILTVCSRTLAQQTTLEKRGRFSSGAKGK